MGGRGLPPIFALFGVYDQTPFLDFLISSVLEQLVVGT